MLYERLKALAKVVDRGPIFIHEGDSKEISFAQLMANARHIQGQLQSHKMQKGDHLAIIIADNELCITTFLGAVMGGIIPFIICPPPIIGDMQNYYNSINNILTVSKTNVLITSQFYKPSITFYQAQKESHPSFQFLLTIEELVEENFIEPNDVQLTPDDICFLQFSSGSSAAPKGVIITHRNVDANAKAILVDALGVDSANDIGVSWLPLYHDMGLVGNLLSALIYEIPVIYIPTTYFIKHPNIWIKTISDYRATISFAPNFAFALATKHASENFVSTLDLSCLRIIGCGAEPINAEVLKQFQDLFVMAGLNPNAITPCYGMAEATLAISFDRIDRPARVISIDRDAYEQDKITKPVSSQSFKNVEIVSCGFPLPGHDIRIVSSNGRFLPDGCIGEIIFRGPSMARGYLENKDEMKKTFRNGWLFTGDLGFLQNGELFLTGRSKDLIIIRGRNYYPQDIEWIVEKIDTVRAGSVVAFGICDKQTEKIIVIAEVKNLSSLKQIEEDIKELVMLSLGVSVADVLFVKRGTLPKTTSGKIQRQRTKLEYKGGTLSRIN